MPSNACKSQVSESTYILRDIASFFELEVALYLGSASQGHERGQLDRLRIECRRGPASQSVVVSTNQAVGKIGGAVFPDKQGFLHRRFILELDLCGIEQAGNCFPDFSLLQAV